MNENLIDAAPNTTILTDGRVAVMRELTGYDEYQVEKFMVKEGAKPDGFGMMLYIKFLALHALTRVGDKEYETATVLAQLIARLTEFKSKDLAKILELYNKVNGRGEPGSEGNEPS